MIVVSYGQAIDQEKLDAYFDALEQNDKLMGTVLLLKDGSPVYTRAVGYADFNVDRKNTLDAEYRLGSISKTFTAILVMQAVQSSKLSLEQKLADYYPSIPNADKITINHLLHHRSGLHSFTDDEDYLTYNTQPKSETELLTLITKGSIRFAPDEQFNYCNSNYVLLSFILEKVHKKSFGQIFDAGIVKPLKLKQTYFGYPDPKSKMANRSYVYEDQWKEETVTNMSIPMGAGGIVSTAVETAQIFHALFGGKLLSDASLAQMIEMKDGYGKGIYTLPFADKQGYGHNGGIDGYNTSAAYFADDKLAVVILANGINYSINDMAIKLLSAYYGMHYELPSFDYYETRPGELAVFTGVYSSNQLPLELTVTDQNDQLVIQATGQGPIPMDRLEANKFAFDRAGIVMIFNPENKTVTLQQGGGEFLFTMKEE
jgi:CubicO group peptidase (beta-lactamase class C family)